MKPMHLPDFDLHQIANSGQCFRLAEISSGIWEVKAKNRCLRIYRDEKGRHIFECSSREFDEIWFDYFDLGRDYGKIKENIRAIGDPYLAAAIDHGHGIRILRQDFWETLVTFIISQRNNIPRIRNIVAKLCEGHGFPTPALLSQYTENDLLSLGLGYRAKYLRNIARAATDGSLNFHELKAMNTSDAIDFLRRFDGIGSKVANCVGLFGLHRIEAVPIDVWIKRIVDKQYGGNFDWDRFSGYAGIVQQYMFFYQRNFLGK